MVNVVCRSYSAEHERRRGATMTWWVVLASFLGAVIGAAIPAMVTLRGQHQQARIEWSQRLDRAIAALTAGSPIAREIGKELLADLIDSDLGNARDRDLAYRIARIDLNSRHMDATASMRDNEHEGSEEDR